MRLWTLHPKYLDPKGLVALWREALLAQSVLRGKSKAYARHPQLARFRDARAPVSCIAEYLRAVHAEGKRRGYRFDAGKIARGGHAAPIIATSGQIRYEWRHLLEKLRLRNPGYLEVLVLAESIDPHPLFIVVPGDVAKWEKRSGGVERRGKRRGPAQKEKIR